MTFKRFAALVVSLFMLFGALTETLGAARAETQEAWQLWETVKPTCTGQGYEVWYNLLTGEYQNRNYKPALGHNYGAWTVISEGNCTTQGLRVHVCSRCGTREMQATAGAHDWGKWETDIPGSCVAQERLVRKCRRCGALDYWTKDYGDHDWGEGVITKAPTATQDGEMTYTCKNDPSHTKTEPIPATGETGALSPALYLKVTWDENAGEGKRYEGALIPMYYTVKNTGDCTVYIDSGEYTTAASTSFPRGAAYVPQIGASRIAIQPGESWNYTYLYSVDEYEVKVGLIDYDSEGVVVDGGEYIDTDGTVKFVGSNNGVIYIPLTYPENPHPQLTDTASWADDAGEGKRYEGAEVEFVITLANTGNCPIVDLSYSSPEIISCIGPSGSIAPDVLYELQPGQSTSMTVRRTVYSQGVETGKLTGNWKSYGQYIDASGERKTIGSNLVEFSIPLTYPGDEKPELSITLWADIAEPPYTRKTEFAVGEQYSFNGSVTNTGNVDIELYDCEQSRSDGWTLNGSQPGTRYLLKPGETVERWNAYWFLGVAGTAQFDKVTPGTQTETLAGTITYTVFVPGYRPGTDEVICSAAASTSIGVLKDGAPHPQLTLTASWADDAGEGKCYEGAEVDVSFTVTNTGDCPVEWYYNHPQVVSCEGSGGTLAPNVKIELKPGEYVTYVYRYIVPLKDAEAGALEVWHSSWGWYTDQSGVRQMVYSNTIMEQYIPLTYPDGEEPEEAKPGLKIEWEYDQVWKRGKGWLENTKTPGSIGAEDAVSTWFAVTNTGNVPLKVVAYASFGDGESDTWSFFEPLGPADSQHDFWNSDRYSPVSLSTKHLTPGTETDEFYGTVTVHYYAAGYDPEGYTDANDPGKELCRTETLSRSWQISKESGWEIPEDSKLTGTLAVAPGYESSDPAGYQMGEEIKTVLTVKNTGLIDLEIFGASDPWDSANFSDGPIAVGGEKSYTRAHVTVTEEDVERGYIEFPMITISWTDPDSEKERTAFAGPLTVHVLKKTGLLLKKGVAFEPENGEFFQEGEPIQWSLTVTNNSKDSITDVTVEDKGKTVGSYTQITPGDTENCIVPVHVVTEYDAKVVGYVLNYATATGTDYRGAVHTWPSNVAKALTKKPTVPGEDLKGELKGLHPAVTITKAEDPHGPLNSSWYEADEPIDYIITIKNVGDTELKDIAVTDSLAGFAPIGTLASLAPGEEKSFTYSYTVKDSDLPFGWVYNSATVTYTFGDNVKGTPKTSDTVQSKVGDDIFPPETPHLDPEKLPGDEDYCSLKLDMLGDGEARYTLHACAEHSEAAIAAEEAAQSGDWVKAAELWKTEVEALYETLYEAADSELKAALVSEKAAYDDYVDGLSALSHEAAANELRVKCAFLCCALHSAPETLESSLAGDYAKSASGEAETESSRVFGPLSGSDSAVTETYAGSIAYAHKHVIGLMDMEKSFDWDKVFLRGGQLWQSALDSVVNPLYKAADRETKKKIALWRISLDSLSAAERPLLELLYEGNGVAIEETLMGLYKDAALTAAGFGKD